MGCHARLGDAAHQTHGRLIQSRLQTAIADTGNLPDDVHFSGRSAPRRQPCPRIDIFRSREAVPIIDPRSCGQSNNRAETRHPLHRGINVVMVCQPGDLCVQPGQLGPQLHAGMQKRQRRGGQNVVLVNRLPYPRLIPHPGDVPRRQTVVLERTGICDAQFRTSAFGIIEQYPEHSACRS